MGIALCVNIAANAWLIPIYSFNGAAMASTISSIVLVLLGLPHVYKYKAFPLWDLSKRILLVLLAGALMATIVYEAQDVLPLVVVILLAVFLYPVSLFITRALSFSEMRLLVLQACGKSTRS